MQVVAFSLLNAPGLLFKWRGHTLYRSYCKKLAPYGTFLHLNKEVNFVKAKMKRAGGSSTNSCYSFPYIKRRFLLAFSCWTLVHIGHD